MSIGLSSDHHTLGRCFKSTECMSTVFEAKGEYDEAVLRMQEHDDVQALIFNGFLPLLTKSGNTWHLEDGYWVCEDKKIKHTFKRFKEVLDVCD